jgi:transcriptional regulator with XRE-family HTH domain
MEQEPASEIRKARIRLGLTLWQVAERCTERGVPISEGQVSRIERGHAAGRPETRAVLAEVLGLDAFDDFEVKSA